MGDKPRALIVSPEAPYPMWGGGSLRTAAVLNYLAKGYRVDAVFFREPQAGDPVEALPPGLVERTLVIDLPFHARGGAARLVRNTGRLARRIPPLVDRFMGFEQPIWEFTRGRRYELGWLEHFWVAPYQPLVAGCCGRVALDLHNIESVWHERMAAADGGLEAWAHRRFASACRSLEAKWLKKFDLLLAASPEDAALAGGAYYPNTIPDPGEVPSGEEAAIVFSGNMAYAPNVSAVRWFTAEIWPEIHRRWPALEWRLVGKNENAIRPLVRGLSNVRVTGAVEDSIPELAAAQAAVVPLRSGSGTRIKILEAWAAGTPVVTTSLGCEGLGSERGVDVVVADRPDDFAESVCHLLESPEIRRRMRLAGRAKFHSLFTWEAGWRTLQALGV